MLAILPNGISLEIFFWKIFFCLCNIPPGEIELNRMFWEPYYVAKYFVKPTTPCLIIEYDIGFEL